MSNTHSPLFYSDVREVFDLELGGMPMLQANGLRAFLELSMMCLPQGDYCANGGTEACAAGVQLPPGDNTNATCINRVHNFDCVDELDLDRSLPCPDCEAWFLSPTYGLAKRLPHLYENCAPTVTFESCLAECKANAQCSSVDFQENTGKDNCCIPYNVTAGHIPAELQGKKRSEIGGTAGSTSAVRIGPSRPLIPLWSEPAISSRRPLDPTFPCLSVGDVDEQEGTCSPDIMACHEPAVMALPETSNAGVVRAGMSAGMAMFAVLIAAGTLVCSHRRGQDTTASASTFTYVPLTESQRVRQVPGFCITFILGILGFFVAANVAEVERRSGKQLAHGAIVLFCAGGLCMWTCLDVLEWVVTGHRRVRTGPGRLDALVPKVPSCCTDCLERTLTFRKWFKKNKYSRKVMIVKYAGEDMVQLWSVLSMTRDLDFGLVVVGGLGLVISGVGTAAIFLYPVKSLTTHRYILLAFDALMDTWFFAFNYYVTSFLSPESVISFSVSLSLAYPLVLLAAGMVDLNYIHLEGFGHSVDDAGVSTKDAKQTSSREIRKKRRQRIQYVGAAIVTVFSALTSTVIVSFLIANGVMQGQVCRQLVGEKVFARFGGLCLCACKSINAYLGC